jgi:hypothetical protein
MAVLILRSPAKAEHRTYVPPSFPSFGGYRLRARPLEWYPSTEVGSLHAAMQSAVRSMPRVEVKATPSHSGVVDDEILVPLKTLRCTLHAVKNKRKQAA